MPQPLIIFVRLVEAVNTFFGRIAMWLFFVLGGVLLWSVLMKALSNFARATRNSDAWAWLWSVLDPSWFQPPLWTQEMAQFTMIAYITLGGAWSLILGANVRMDLLYGRWNPRGQALADVITVFALIIFLGVILWGGLESTLYAFEIGERSRTAWRPYMAPVKIIICFGVFLMLLQSLAFLVRDIATLRGRPIA